MGAIRPAMALLMPLLLVGLAGGAAAQPAAIVGGTWISGERTPYAKGSSFMSFQPNGLYQLITLFAGTEGSGIRKFVGRYQITGGQTLTFVLDARYLCLGVDGTNCADYSGYDRIGAPTQMTFRMTGQNTMEAGGQSWWRQ